ncbi:MAG TPA: MerR family transcriptional regulator [Myxococcales bacterium LLY-WYZ-16_1]|jgi:MerR family transcriptional regulator, copper efflux regulator|nr:MerR family transcriptional regulator [Myxococcales bacterium LLY-WYZ-16_1]
MADTVILQPGASKASLKIGDLARKASKSPRALRLYEEMGLLGPAVRTEGGHRLYSNDALVRLSWIDRLQLLGLSLTEIRDLLGELEGSETGARAMKQVDTLFRAKLAEVRSQLEALQSLERELEDSIRYLESCHSCPTHVGVAECRDCAQPHAVDEPLLISGIHRNGGNS